MKKSLLKLLWVVAGLMLSTTISAVGMGGINVTSGLGQQLKADIELVSVNNTEKTSLVARLASPEVYKGAGLEYPYGNKFKFQIESRPNGAPYLNVTSAQPVNDPFVVMLVELSWSSGRLLREYTFLLDPPGYVMELPVQTKVQAVAPSVQPETPQLQTAEVTAMLVEPTAPQEEVAESQVAPDPDTSSADSEEQDQDVAASASESDAVPSSEQETLAVPAEQEIPIPDETLSQEAADEAVAPENIAMGEFTEPNEEWIGVQRGDTLGKISLQYKSADVSLERMLVAMYRANAAEFGGKNMNRIGAGKILRLPNQQEIDAVGQSEAAKEIRAQTADWNVYRQKLAGAASVSSRPQTAEQVASGKLTSSVADKAPVSKDSAKEVLKLSRGEAPGDQAETGAGDKSKTAQEKNNAAQEDAIATVKTVKEGQARTAMLEKNLEDIQRLTQLKSEAAALAQQPEAAVPLAVEASADKSAPARLEPSLIDQAMAMLDEIFAEPLYLFGGAGTLLALGGLGWVASRRKKRPSFEIISKFTEKAESETGHHIAIQPDSSPEKSDFTHKIADQGEQSQDVDPISEADLFLNFGRDVQAEEILKDALQNTPNNHRIHLKLLEIYAARKDVNAFAAIVRQLQDSGDAEASQQALAMGRGLEPNNPMYGDSKGKEISGSGDMQAQAFNAMPNLVTGIKSIAKPPSVDFDLGGATSVTPAQSPEQDLLSSMVKTTAMSPDAIAAKPAGGMDFDITADDSLIPVAGEQEKSTMPDLDDLIFDVTGQRPAIVEEQEVSLPKLGGKTFDLPGNKPSMQEKRVGVDRPAHSDDNTMEFTLDFPVEDKAQKSELAALPADVDFAGISLNLDDTAAPISPTTEIKDEHWQEVATKLDLAKAYQEMGDASGAREILEEVLREGDDAQREVARSLLDQLG